MLKQIDVVYGTEEDEQALSLPILGLTPKDSLLLRKVTGLNPPDVNLFIGDYSRDGGTYQGRRVESRNVVLTIDLNPNPALGETVSGLREMLYKIFGDPRVEADFSQLILREDDGRARYLVGYTDKIESDLFSSDRLIQISMICPDPYIRDLIETSITSPTGWLTVPFVYGGTAETGFEVKIKVNTPTSVITLSNNKKTMVLYGNFLINDIISINTNRGSRKITLTRAGVTTSIAALLTPESRWLELHSQANSMTIYGNIPSVRPASILELKYTPSYWGV